MSTLIDLDRPKAKIVARHGFRVYGWTRELVTDRGTVPMPELVSIHAFEWTARRAMRRWLKQQTQALQAAEDERWESMKR